MNVYLYNMFHISILLGSGNMKNSKVNTNVKLKKIKENIFIKIYNNLILLFNKIMIFV